MRAVTASAGCNEYQYLQPRVHGLLTEEQSCGVLGVGGCLRPGGLHL